MKLLMRIFLGAQVFFVGAVVLFGLALLVLGAIAGWQGRWEPGTIVAGVFMAFIGVVVLRDAWREYRLIARALEGDAGASADLQSHMARNVKWVWRLNGPLMTLMCLGFAVAMPFAADAPLWMRIVVPPVAAVGFVFFVRRSWRAWRC